MSEQPNTTLLPQSHSVSHIDLGKSDRHMEKCRALSKIWRALYVPSQRQRREGSEGKAGLIGQRYRL